MLNVDKSKTYLLACSFGPDSMALFSLLMENQIKFEVAHVNYHLRKESDDEEAGLRAYCEQNNVKIHVLNVKETIEHNVEGRCREIRYDFFAKLCHENVFAAVLVAHQEDDLIETYLLQKIRKNLVNYYGIKELTTIKDTIIIRPLLTYTKKDLEQLCNNRKVPYAIDQSNLTKAYKRNQIRIDVVSKLTEVERRAILKEINEKNHSLSFVLDKISKLDNKIDTLCALSSDELAYYLYSKVSAIKPNYQLTHKCVNEVMKLMHSNKPNIIMIIARDVVIEKAYDELIVRAKNKEQSYSFLIEKPCELDNEYFYLDFRGNTSNRNVSLDDYPLTIRTYKKGDTYLIKDYQVPVRRLFIDWKMPLALRKRWPIILDKDNKIIYIPRYRKDFKIDPVPNFYVK